MRPWQRERVLGEQRGAGETIRGALERRALERDLDFNTLKGKPLRQRLRTAAQSAESYVVSLGGPLPYMQRLRAIEDETADHELRLEAAWRALAGELGTDADAFAARWRHAAQRWSFHAVNALIDKHNRYYPIETRLPMDPRTGDFALVSGRHYQLTPLDAAWVLERFPPLLDAAHAEPPRATPGEPARPSANGSGYTEVGRTDWPARPSSSAS